MGQKIILKCQKKSSRGSQKIVTNICNFDQKAKKELLLSILPIINLALFLAMLDISYSPEPAAVFFILGELFVLVLMVMDSFGE